MSVMDVIAMVVILPTMIGFVLVVARLAYFISIEEIAAGATACEQADPRKRYINFILPDEEQ